MLGPLQGLGLSTKLTALLCVLLVLLTGCSKEEECNDGLTCECHDIADCAATREEQLFAELSYAQDKWSELQSDSYSFDIGYVCYCESNNEFSIYFSDTEPLIFNNDSQTFVDHVFSKDNSLHQPENLFSLIESHINSADKLDFEYDRDTGLPTSIELDPDYAIADDELTVTISNIAASTETVCTTEYVHGMTLSVLDADTNENISCLAEATISNDDYVETLIGDGECELTNTLTGLGERAGRFDIEVRALGYQPKQFDDVDVMRDFCHVRPQQLTVELEPE
jgi:hypothetical protein